MSRVNRVSQNFGAPARADFKSSTNGKRFQHTMNVDAAKKMPDSRFCEFIRTLRSVRSWVEETLDITLNDDLFISLKSGVILCYLMQQIEPGSIPRIQEGTDQNFKQRENIEFFILAASDYGVPRHRLFHPPDLCDNDCMVTVVECLAELARVSYKKGFPVALPEVKKEEYNSDEAIMKKYSDEEVKRLKTQLVRVKEPSNGKVKKMSEVILRRKLELLTGGKGDSECLDILTC